MNKALFITENTLIENSIINENVSYSMIRPTIVKVQEMRIQPILGSALYNEIVTQVKTTPQVISAQNVTLLQDHIQPAIIQWLYYELPSVLSFRFVNRGMVRQTSDNTTPMSIEEIVKLTDKALNDAEWYSERITRHLMENRTLYPLWNNPPAKLDTIYPNMTNYNAGMVLRRNTRRGSWGMDYPYNYGNTICNEC